MISTSVARCYEHIEKNDSLLCQSYRQILHAAMKPRNDISSESVHPSFSVNLSENFSRCSTHIELRRFQCQINSLKPFSTPHHIWLLHNHATAFQLPYDPRKEFLDGSFNLGVLVLLLLPSTLILLLLLPWIAALLMTTLLVLLIRLMLLVTMMLLSLVVISSVARRIPSMRLRELRRHLRRSPSKVDINSSRIVLSGIL